MKVLEKGPGWSMEVKCTGSGNGGGGCGAKLLIERGDVYLTHSYDYGGGHDVYYTIRCPECDVQTDIEYDKLPSFIRDEAAGRRRVLSRER
ncbi:MAG: hypothetical protein E7171_05385 [Firmicutes bacterium]|jgi:hypothetical protein|nr:hypothetical protein [Bacillota bacterium]